MKKISFFAERLTSNVFVCKVPFTGLWLFIFGGFKLLLNVWFYKGSAV